MDLAHVVLLKGVIKLGAMLLMIALLSALVVAQGGYWHVYDSTIKPSKDSKCAKYSKDQPQNVSYLVEKYKMWPRLTDFDRPLNENSTVYGMGYAFEEIWRHQHPEDCSKVKFLINGFHNGGFGSELHVLGAVLGLGLEMGRVVVQNPLVHSAVAWEMENPFCHQSESKNLQCYYEPWSSCTIFDALGPDALKILKRAPIMGPGSFHLPNLVGFAFGTDNVAKLNDENFRNNFIKQYDSLKTVLVKVPGWMKHGIVPHTFKPLLQCSPIKQEFHYYWWRAISTAYLVRPNAAVIEWIKKHGMQEYDKTDNYVSVYIRRGDKSIEAKLPPVDSFTMATDMLYNQKLMDGNGDEKRLMFLASEDSKVLSAMTEWNKQTQRYHMNFTNVFDRKGLLAERSAEEREKHLYRGPDHHPEEYLSMLLNVHYLVRGNGYVCTLSSNFCRLVDELRATVAGKADRPYADLSEETCTKPPCVFEGIKYLDWR